jgi:hypothetical protein
VQFWASEFIVVTIWAVFTFYIFPFIFIEGMLVSDIKIVGRVNLTLLNSGKKVFHFKPINERVTLCDYVIIDLFCSA